MTYINDFGTRYGESFIPEGYRRIVLKKFRIIQKYIKSVSNSIEKLEELNGNNRLTQDVILSNFSNTFEEEYNINENNFERGLTNKPLLTWAEYNKHRASSWYLIGTFDPEEVVRKSYIDRAYQQSKIKDRIEDTKKDIKLKTKKNQLLQDVFAYKDVDNIATQQLVERIQNAEDINELPNDFFGFRELGETFGLDNRFEKLEEDSAEILRDSEQCILMRNLKLFADRSEFRLSKTDAYTKVYMIDSAEPSLMMSRLNSTKNGQELLDIRPHELSQLIPMMRFYRVVYDDSGKFEKEVEISFDGAISQADVLGGNPGRSGIGVKSFEWKYNATNKEAIRNDVTAKLTIYFQNFNKLLEIKKDKNGNIYSYMDLILYSMSNRAIQDYGNISDPALEDIYRKNSNNYKTRYDGKHFELKAIVGWAFDESEGYTFINKSKLIESLENSREILFLTMTDHNFSINQDGTMELSINYRARLEGTLTDINSNVLSNTKTKKANKRFEKTLEKLNSNCNEKEAKRLRQQKEQYLMVERKRMYESIITDLIKNDMIYQLSIDKEALTHLTGGLYAAKGEAYIKNNKQAVEKALNNSIEYIADPNAPVINKIEYLKDNTIKPTEIIDPGTENYILNYFYIGDLIEIVSKKVLNEGVVDENQEESSGFNIERSKRIKILLTTIEIIDNLNKKFQINLADIPISIHKYKEFFNENVIKKKRYNYELLHFMRDLVNYLLSDAITEGCIGFNNEFNIKVGTTSFPAYSGKDPIGVIANEQFNEKYGTGDEYTTLYKQAKDTALTKKVDIDVYVRNTSDNSKKVIRNYNKNEDTNNVYEYLVIYSNNEDIRSLLGNKTFDQDQGVYHLSIGADKGLLKQINFQKTDQPYLAEARYQREGFMPLSQLANVYDVTLNLFGNTLFYPGSYFYLNPLGLGSDLGPTYEPSSISAQMGLGGYHIVTKVESYIDNGKFETIVTGRWETGGGRTPSIQQRAKGKKSISCSQSGVNEKPVSANSIANKFKNTIIEQ